MLKPGGWAQCTETSPPQWDTEYGPGDPDWAQFATMLRTYCDERKKLIRWHIETRLGKLKNVADCFVTIFT